MLAAKAGPWGGPKAKRAKDKDAKTTRRLRNDGQSYGEIATELGRSKSDIYRVCMTLGCAAANRESTQALLV